MSEPVCDDLQGQHVAEYAPDRRGLCQCGCGEPVPLAKETRRGLMKGKPVRFLRGHQRRVGRIDRDGRECITCGIYKPWSEFDTLARGRSRSYVRLQALPTRERPCYSRPWKKESCCPAMADSEP